MLKRFIYQNELVSADETEDGVPVMLEVTRETNGYAVWLQEAGHNVLIKHFQHQGPALKWGIRAAQVVQESPSDREYIITQWREEGVLSDPYE